MQMTPSSSTTLISVTGVTVTNASGAPRRFVAEASSEATTLLRFEGQTASDPAVGMLKGQLPEGLTMEAFSGKGGHCLVLSSAQPDLFYFVLPGGQVSAADASWSLSLAEPAYVPELPDYPAAPVEPRTQNISTQAMILGAGIGSRILPLTDERLQLAKPALPLDADHTVIGRLVEQLAQYGFKRLFVNTFYYRASVQQALQTACKQVGMKLIEIVEDRATGTAGGLHTMLQKPANYPDFNPNEPILILQGDAVGTANFADLMQAHADRKACLSLGCQTVPDADVDKFGIVATDSSENTQNPSGWTEFFLEKPALKDAGPHRFASNGYYVLNASTYGVLQEVYAAKLQQEQAAAATKGLPAPSEVEEIDFAMDLFPAVMERSEQPGFSKIYAHKTDGFWCDIGNPLHYFETLKAIYNGHLGYELPADLTPFTDASGPLYWPGAKAKALNDRFSLQGRVLVTSRSQTV